LDAKLNKMIKRKAEGLEPRRKIFVGMSGGVDSSAAAALLKKKGYSPAGVFMKFWSEGKSCAENKCCSSESERRALLTAGRLGIPFYTLNLEKEFKEKIVEFFLKELKNGRTPNPCVVCNKEIKFNLLLNKFAGGNELFATGHYAKVRNGRLFKAKDKDKDQTYFLWKLDKNALEKVVFPLADFKKAQTRKIAKEYNLPSAETPESQEICFISSELNDFLKRNIGIKKGQIMDTRGNILGEHEGLWFYTIGQRKGLGFSGGPYYVVRKDPKDNILFVSRNKKDLLQKELIFKDANWISGKEPKFPIKVEAKIRSAHAPAKAVIDKPGHLVFEKAQTAVTPGQSAVFYKGEELVGGGVIAS